MKNRLSRRELLGSLAATSAMGAGNSQTLPTRPFGATGERVTSLAIGCGNRLLSRLSWKWRTAFRR